MGIVPAFCTLGNSNDNFARNRIHSLFPSLRQTLSFSIQHYRPNLVCFGVRESENDGGVVRIEDQTVVEEGGVRSACSGKDHGVSNSGPRTHAKQHTEATAWGVGFSPPNSSRYGIQQEGRPSMGRALCCRSTFRVRFLPDMRTRRCSYQGGGSCQSHQIVLLQGVPARNSWSAQRATTVIWILGTDSAINVGRGDSKRAEDGHLDEQI